MAAAIRLREDFDAQALRRLARASRDAKQTLRLLALACIYDGGSRTQAAKIGGVGLQIVRDWVLRFNEEGPAGLLDRKAPGKVPTLNDAQRAALVEKIETGPLPYLDGVVRWRLVDLVQWLWEEFGLSIAGRPWAASCAPWASASSPLGRSTTLRPRRPWRGLKKLPGRAASDRTAPRLRCRARNLVSR